MQGGCQCGNIRYNIEGKPIGLNVCHCKDCQRQSGSAFGMSLIIYPESFMLLSGHLKEFELQVESGRTKTCAFCPDCGVRIYNRTSALCSVKAGTLDDTRSLQPDAHYWTRSMQSWPILGDDIPQHETHE
jgi:hypothetical protein